MVDLKEIPSELQNLLTEYSKLSTRALNIASYLDVAKLDIGIIGSLSDFMYFYIKDYIETNYKCDTLKHDIEAFLRDKLNLQFSQAFIWENKIEIV